MELKRGMIFRNREGTKCIIANTFMEGEIEVVTYRFWVKRRKRWVFNAQMFVKSLMLNRIKKVDMESEIKENKALSQTSVSGNTWEDLWQEFILDCEKSNKKIIEPSDFFFWLDYGFKVPERL